MPPPAGKTSKDLPQDTRKPDHSQRVTNIDRYSGAGKHPQNPWNTHVALNLHHVPGKLDVHGVRQVGVVVEEVFVVGIGNRVLTLFSSLDTEHVRRRVVVSLRLLVVFLVLQLRLNLCYIHVVDELRVVLQASEPNVLSLCLFVGFFIFILETEERDWMCWGRAVASRVTQRRERNKKEGKKETEKEGEKLPQLSLEKEAASSFRKLNPPKGPTRRLHLHELIQLHHLSWSQQVTRTTLSFTLTNISLSNVGKEGKRFPKHCCVERCVKNTRDHPSQAVESKSKRGERDGTASTRLYEAPGALPAAHGSHCQASCFMHTPQPESVHCLLLWSRC